jgi:hypothetical protein
MTQEHYLTNWDTGSAFDFKEIFNEDSEVFIFSYIYLMHDYRYFIEQAQKSKNIEKSNLFNKMHFSLDSYEKRALSVFLNSRLLKRDNIRHDVINKNILMFNTGKYFINEEMFKKIKTWFLFYLSNVKHVALNNDLFLVKMKLLNF